MSDEDKKGRDIYYIVGLVAAGVVIIGLIAGLASMAAKQKKAAAKMKRIGAIKDWLGTTFPPGSEANALDIAGLEAIQTAVKGILESVERADII